MARYHTEDSKITRKLGVHDHAPDTAEIEARKTWRKMKDRAVTKYNARVNLSNLFSNTSGQIIKCQVLH